MSTIHAQLREEQKKVGFNFLSPEFLAQLTHVAFGALVFLTVLLIAFPMGAVWMWLALGFMIVVLIKESLIDPRIESNQPFFWKGVVDMGFYFPGYGLGTLIWVIVVVWWAGKGWVW
jgi:hypothetical protein